MTQIIINLTNFPSLDHANKEKRFQAFDGEQGLLLLVRHVDGSLFREFYSSSDDIAEGLIWLERECGDTPYLSRTFGKTRLEKTGKRHSVKGRVVSATFRLGKAILDERGERALVTRPLAEILDTCRRCADDKYYPPSEPWCWSCLRKQNLKHILPRTNDVV